MRKNLAKHTAKKLPLAKRVLALCFALIFVCSCLLPAFANGTGAELETPDTEVVEAAAPGTEPEPMDFYDEPEAVADEPAAMDDDFAVADEPAALDDDFACLLVPASEDAIFDVNQWDANLNGLLDFAQENALHLHSDTLDTVRAREGAQVLAMSTCSTEFTDARTILLAWMTTPEQ